MTVLLNILRLILAVLLCWFVASAVLVVGWVARLSRRTALKALLAKRGRVAIGRADAEPFAENAHWPGWIAGPKGHRRGVRGWLGGLLENLRLGLACLVPTLIVTAPAGILWLLGWWGGWNNSFNKGYEQSWVGPAVGVVGILLWLAVVPLVPLARARVAVTGDWRAFFGLRVLRRIAARQRWPLVCLALLAIACALWFVFIRAIPPFVLQTQIPDIEKLTVDQTRAISLAVYLSTGAVMLAGYLLVHLWAARIYAAGLHRAVAGGFLQPDRLHAGERAVLDAIEAVPVRESAGAAPPRRPNLAVRGLNSALALPLTIAGWFVVAALLYVAQFLLYAPANWLVHPLVHLPWVRLFGVW